MRVKLSVRGFYYNGKYYESERVINEKTMKPEFYMDVPDDEELIKYMKEKGYILAEVKPKPPPRMDGKVYPKTVIMYHNFNRKGREFVFNSKEEEEEMIKKGWKYEPIE